MSKILVTGATGKIGAQLVTTLLARGAAVRAGIRSPDQPGDVARELAAGGAELVRFDLQDPDTVRHALIGVDRLFVLAPPMLLEPSLIGAVLGAAREAGVRSIVKVSSMGATANSASHFGRLHAASDELIRRSGLDWTLLLPTFFMDNLLVFAIDGIRAHGAFYGAAGDGKISFVSSRDIAEVSAAVLLDPGAHRGKEYVLTGPEAVSNAEVAALVSEAAGRTIRYFDVSPEQFRASVIGGGVPAAFADGLVALEAVKAAGGAAAISPAVEQVLGHPGERYRDFLLRNRARLA